MQNIMPKYNPTKRQLLLEKYKKNIHSNTVEKWVRLLKFTDLGFK